MQNLLNQNCYSKLGYNRWEGGRRNALIVTRNILQKQAPHFFFRPLAATLLDKKRFFFFFFTILFGEFSKKLRWNLSNKLIVHLFGRDT